jgi:adenylate kinase
VARSGVGRPGERPAVGFVALTGVPGTGKSAVASRLGPPTGHAEVADLARRAGGGRRRGRAVEVDLARLGRWLGAHPPEDGPFVVVGHLAHLLPIRDVIVLRCHPVELLGRLRKARRGTAADRADNVVAEATDVVLVEALGLGRRVWEVDTTGRPVGEVARAVDRIVRDRPAPQRRYVDWLGDILVTDYLLPALR